MKRSDRWSRCARHAAAALLALSVVTHGPAAFAQGTTGSPPSAPAVQTRTTTSPDGLTTTTVTATPRLGGYIITTVVTTRDKDHFVLTEVTTTSDDTGLSGYTERTITKKYNALGGYAETIDEKYTGKIGDTRILTTHEELQCDADGNVISGTRTTGGSDVIGDGSVREPIPAQKYMWDTGTKTWTSSQGASWTPAQPDTGTATDATEEVIAPPVSSPGKQIMVTYRDNTSSIPRFAFYEGLNPTLGQIDTGRGGVYYSDKVIPEPTVLSFYLNLPTNARSVSIFKGFDGNGKPDAHASFTTVSADAPVAGMNLPGAPAPAGQPAIVASAGAYDVRAGTITVQTQNTSVADTLLLETGQPLTTLAASDRSMVAALPRNISLGRHALSLAELLAPQSVYPQTVPFDAISLTVDPMPPVEEVGDTATPTVHVLGMPAGDAAVMEFLVGGSAELAGGGTFTSVPVVGNVASCTIVGVRSGEALVKFHLRLVSMAATPQ